MTDATPAATTTTDDDTNATATAPTTIVIAVDGSRLSRTAFRVALSLRRSTDFLSVYHVYDSFKPNKLVANYYSPECKKLFIIISHYSQ